MFCISILLYKYYFLKYILFKNAIAFLIIILYSAIMVNSVVLIINLYFLLCFIDGKLYHLNIMSN